MDFNKFGWRMWNGPLKNQENFAVDLNKGTHPGILIKGDCQALAEGYAQLPFLFIQDTRNYFSRILCHWLSPSATLKKKKSEIIKCI